LTTCAECTARLAELQATAAALRQLERPLPPAAVGERLRRQLAAERERRPRPVWLDAWYLAASPASRSLRRPRRGRRGVLPRAGGAHGRRQNFREGGPTLAGNRSRTDGRTVEKLERGQTLTEDLLGRWPDLRILLGDRVPVRMRHEGRIVELQP
jgi:hypothetical protein